MKIIQSTPNKSGAYPPVQVGDFKKCPEGCFGVSEDVDLGMLYEYNGFVELVVENNVVVGVTPKAEAWEAWKQTQPEPEEETV